MAKTSVNSPSTIRSHNILSLKNTKTLIIIAAVTAVILVLIAIIIFLAIWKTKNRNNDDSGKFLYLMVC